MVDCNLEGRIKKVSILMWRTLFARLVLCSVILLLSACSMMADRNSGTSGVATGTGGIGTKDGAPAVSIDVAEISDVQPHPVVRTIAGNKSPYVVFGKRYTVLEDSHGFRQRGTASWYGTKFHGRRTSTGEVYNMYAMTAAHKTLPIPSYVKVTNLDNQRSNCIRKRCEQCDR